MTKDKIIDVLKDLKDYVNENWSEEYREQIDDVNEVVDFLIPTISNSMAVVGELTLDGKKYIISEPHNDNTK